MNLSFDTKYSFGFGEQCSSLVARLANLQEMEGNANLYSLIDGAKLVEAHNLMSRLDSNFEVHSLLSESAAEEAACVGPLLVLHKNREHCQFLAQLLAAPGSATFISLIISQKPLTTLKNKLSWMTNVRYQEDTEWIMRYYDPLVLPHWLAVLDPPQRSIVLDGISQWIFVDENGDHQIDRPNIVEFYPHSDDQLMLMKDARCEYLMDKAMPYMIMALLKIDNPQALEDINQSKRYGFSFQEINNAKKFDLSTPVDLKTYCMLALLFGAEFNKHKFILDSLKSIPKGYSFSDCVLEWTSEQWCYINNNFIAF